MTLATMQKQPPPRPVEAIPARRRQAGSSIACNTHGRGRPSSISYQIAVRLDPPQRLSEYSRSDEHGSGGVQSCGSAANICSTIHSAKKVLDKPKYPPYIHPVRKVLNEIINVAYLTCRTLTEKRGALTCHLFYQMRR
jgi:hypothetical protein